MGSGATGVDASLADTAFYIRAGPFKERVTCGRSGQHGGPGRSQSVWGALVACNRELITARSESRTSSTPGIFLIIWIAAR